MKNIVNNCQIGIVFFLELLNRTIICWIYEIGLCQSGKSRLGYIFPQRKWNRIFTMMAYCWASDGPALSQHCVNVSCLLGNKSDTIAGNIFSQTETNPNYIIWHKPYFTVWQWQWQWQWCLFMVSSRQKSESQLKAIYHPLYTMNKFVTKNQSCHKIGHTFFLISCIWGDWLSCDPLRESRDSQSPHIRT